MGKIFGVTLTMERFANFTDEVTKERELLG